MVSIYIEKGVPLLLFIVLYEENSCSDIIDWECRDRSRNAEIKVRMPIWIRQIVECNLWLSNLNCIPNPRMQTYIVSVRDHKNNINKAFKA